MHSIKQVIGFALLLITICASKNIYASEEPSPKVLISTTQGDIIVELSNKTPEHRDNFLQLIKQGAYVDKVFHRAIPNFIIQTGDMHKRLSWEEELALIKKEHTIPAEIKDSLLHKRGSLSMARMENLGLRSSGTHFTIQIGEVYTDLQLDEIEHKINQKRKLYYALNMAENKQTKKQFVKATNVHTFNPPEIERISDLILGTEGYPEGFTKFSFSHADKEIYKTIGGNPKNDQLYTVFGQVLSGMDVVDAISNVPTDPNDWPLQDVRIVSMELIRG